MKDYTKEPFDLEKAKAGHPLVTRSGKDALFVGVADMVKLRELGVTNELSYPVSVYVTHLNQILNYTNSGTFYTNRDDEDDLFLKVKVVVKQPVEPVARWKWAYRHKNKLSTIPEAYLWFEDTKFFTEEEAANAYSKSCEYEKLEYTRTEFKS